MGSQIADFKMLLDGVLPKCMKAYNYIKNHKNCMREEKAKLSCLFRERSTITFISDWKLLVALFGEKKKK